MRKDIKKLIKFSLITVAVFGLAFFIFMFWVAIKIVGPAGTSKLEEEGYKVSSLLECKKMLMSENAWNPSIDYNYVYYFKSGSCPSPEKLKNVAEVQKEFCDRVAEKDKRLHNIYMNVDKICPEEKL